jgi:hypothetical protein
MRLFEKVGDRDPVLCQHLRNWYRNEFPEIHLRKLIFFDDESKCCVIF